MQNSQTEPPALYSTAAAADDSVDCRFGQPVRRFEDARFLTGKGRYVSDIHIPGMAPARMLRSQHAAGRIRRLNVEAALAAPGVIAVLTGDDLAKDGLGCFAPFTSRQRADGTPNIVPPYGLLAKEEVRHVGDIIAMVVAESEAAADFALELIEVSIDPTACVTDTREAAAPDAPPVWPEEPSNICFVERLGDAKRAAAAFADAAHIVEAEYVISRVIASPMETRSAIGVFDSGENSYTLYAGLQTPHLLRNEIANNVLHIEPASLRVISPDIGGGFGLKASMQRELALVLWAARRTARAVRWVAERSESFLADHHARDTVSRVSLALDASGKFLALRVHTIANLGAYLDTFGLHIPVNNLGGLSGPYDIGAFDIEVRGVFSHTQPTAPYRGAGRPEATLCIERIIDRAARQLGMDAVALRRRNMIPSSAMPFETGLAFRLDSGEFEKTMDMAIDLADWKGRESRAADAASRGRLHGIGIAYAVEIAGGPQNTPLKESAELRFDSTGHATLFLGTHSHGQGHETAFRQLAHSFLGLSPGQIDIQFGDTAIVKQGVGTFGSRSVGIGGAALKQAAEKIIEMARPLAVEMLEVSESDVDFLGGHFVVGGTDYRVSLQDVAAHAFKAPAAAAGGVAGLAAHVMAAPDNCTFPNACHVCEVEIENDTGQVQLTRYAVVEDVGSVLNPLLLEGQIHGGVAQGVGQVLCEAITFDPSSGQLISGSFMDYCLPRADDLPMIALRSHEVPSENTPFGIKGAGEAGTVGGMAAMSNAVFNALYKVGVSHFDMPATSERVWRAIHRKIEKATP